LLALVSACDLHPQGPPCRVEDPQPGYRSNAGCVVLVNGHVLLLTHRDDGKLGVPGGAREGNESAQCTAHRETWEETGLDLRVGRMLGRMRYGYTLYRCHADQSMDSAREPELPWFARPEMTDISWMRPNEIPLERWRYIEQERAFRDLLNKALQDSTHPRDPEATRD
jgi:8-oxo-dGTP pyrophosphatase MutT (NUDIX family)